VDRDAFQKRTKELALRIIRLVRALPTEPEADVIGRQLLRCGTSVGANYRAACRAKSPADMINKLKIVEEEADETLYWLELLTEAEVMPAARLQDLIQETDEIVAMTVASLNTLRSRTTNRQSSIYNHKS